MSKVWLPITYTIYTPYEGFEAPKLLLSYTQLTKDVKGVSKWHVNHPAGSFEFFGTKVQLQEQIEQMGYSIPDKQRK